MKSDRPKLLRAYGDRAGDGMVQLCFTLELLPSPKAKEAARRFAQAHGLDDVLVTAMEQCGPEHTYFVVYGHSKHSVDASRIEVATAEVPDLSKEEIDKLVSERLHRKIVVVGACTGSDAHTVGIDAILNYKGFRGEKGLESYKAFDAHNLGAQVENVELAQRARALGADAILVSQIITQRDCHKENGRALVELLEKQGWRDRVLLLFGGPRIDNKLARSIGFDAGFGPGTTPTEVAAYIVEQVSEREASRKAPKM
jgi:beta-lysine 5,6-aminomutase beta subunit